MSSTSAFSYSFLHLCSRSFHSISLSTESYAFCRSMRRLYFLFLRPCTSYSKRLACIAVDFPSLKPVWYTLDDIRWAHYSLIFDSIAFSIIFDMWERTTIGLISSRLTGPLVYVFWSGTNLPTLKYSGITAEFRAAVISLSILSPKCSLFCMRFPSKQSGPSPLLKLLLFAASTTYSSVNSGTLPLLEESICIVSSTSKSIWSGLSSIWLGLL